MPEYRVEWSIDILAGSPRKAAEQALAIQRNPESIATSTLVFDVTLFDSTGESERIDLLEDEEDEEEDETSTEVAQ